MVKDHSQNLISDPKQIAKICKKFGIENYSIKSDGTVDVDGDVNLIEKNLTHLPFQFGIVTGHFWCWDNGLTTLYGSPEIVRGDFDCFSNKYLTTLDGSPRYVGGRFDCSYTSITNLIGSPDEVDGFFYCCSTKLTSFEGLPRLIGLGFSCQNNEYLKDPSDLRDLFLEDFFNCEDTPLKNLIDIFDSFEEFRYSLDYNYLLVTETGTKIIKWKFEESLKENDVEMPESIEGYEFV